MIQVFHCPTLGSICADMLQASDSPAINHMNVCIKRSFRSGSLNKAPRIEVLQRKPENSFGGRNGVCEKTIYIRLLKCPNSASDPYATAVDGLVISAYDRFAWAESHPDRWHSAVVPSRGGGGVALVRSRSDCLANVPPVDHSVQSGSSTGFAGRPSRFLYVADRSDLAAIAISLRHCRSRLRPALLDASS